MRGGSPGVDFLSSITANLFLCREPSQPGRNVGEYGAKAFVPCQHDFRITEDCCRLHHLNAMFSVAPQTERHIPLVWPP